MAVFRILKFVKTEQNDKTLKYGMNMQCFEAEIEAYFVAPGMEKMR